MISQLENSTNLSEAKTKRFFTREYEKFENLAYEIDKNLMREIVNSESIDLDAFMEGLQKSAPKNNIEKAKE